MYNVHTVDLALLLLRLVIGTFFVLARFRWVYDAAADDMPEAVAKAIAAAVSAISKLEVKP